MTCLSVYRDNDPAAPETVTRDWLVAAGLLAHAGILFERWDADADLGSDAGSDAVFAAYAAPMERLMEERGFRSRDVVRVTPTTPGLDEVHRRFVREHTHTEDEARVFVAGSGCFCMHTDRRVFRIVCERGDLLNVPAGMPHWFDMGPRPEFTAIRLFTRPEGWVADYTGDPIAGRFPAYEGGGAGRAGGLAAAPSVASTNVL